MSFTFFVSTWVIQHRLSLHHVPGLPNPKSIIDSLEHILVFMYWTVCLVSCILFQCKAFSILENMYQESSNNVYMDDCLAVLYSLETLYCSHKVVLVSCCLVNQQ